MSKILKDNQIYKMRAKLNHSKKVYRDLLINGNYSLQELAELILESFNFDNDHCYGFYSKFTQKYSSEEKYELFADIENDESQAKKVGTAYIDKVFFEKKKMLFFFDYGDSWEFEIECLGIEKLNQKINKYEVIKVNGEAPEQYPDYEEEED